MFGAGRPTDGAAERMHRAILGCGARCFWACTPSLPARTVYAARVLMSDPGRSPRVRRRLALLPVGGSPPRVRGRSDRTDRHLKSSGVIPARPGRAPSCSSRSRTASVDPRARVGERRRRFKDRVPRCFHLGFAFLQGCGCPRCPQYRRGTHGSLYPPAWFRWALCSIALGESLLLRRVVLALAGEGLLDSAVQLGAPGLSGV